MSRNVFIGSGEHSAKYLGEYKADWYSLKRSIVAMLDMAMFGFPMVKIST
jgi:alpha-glucosidase (family GH31 glycosyl hydrolase)